MQDPQQQLQAEVIQLKARLLDAKDNLESTNSIVGRIAQAAGYEGNEADGLIESIKALRTKQGGDNE